VFEDTPSIWTYINAHKKRFINPFYVHAEHALKPSYYEKDMRYWEVFINFSLLAPKLILPKAYFSERWDPLYKKKESIAQALASKLQKIENEGKNNKNFIRLTSSDFYSEEFKGGFIFS